MKLSNFYSEQNYILTAKNSIFLIENCKNSLIFSNTGFNQSVDDQLFALEPAFHPKNLYLLSYEKIYIYDQRSSFPEKLINKQQNSKRFFSIKHCFDQYFLTSSSKSLDFYDFRNPKSPVLEIKHFLEENPPTILDFSSQLTEFQKNWSSLESDIKNMEILENYCIFPIEKKIFTAFSPKKSGSLVANIIEKSIFDEENSELKNLMEISRDPIFSYEKYRKNLTPILLYSNNIRDLKYRISGVSCFSLENSQKNQHNLHFVFENDNFGGLMLQVLTNEMSDSTNKLNHLALDFKENNDFEEFIDLNQLKLNRLFEKEENYNRKISLNFHNDEIFDDNDMKEMNENDEGELEPLNQEIEEKNIKHQNLDKIFKKLLKKSQKIHEKKTVINQDLVKIESEIDLPSHNDKVQDTQMNLEDMIFNQSTDELSKPKKNVGNYYNEGYLITDELEEHLKTIWEEDET